MGKRGTKREARGAEYRTNLNFRTKPQQQVHAREAQPGTFHVCTEGHGANTCAYARHIPELPGHGTKCSRCGVETSRRQWRQRPQLPDQATKNVYNAQRERYKTLVQAAQNIRGEHENFFAWVHTAHTIVLLGGEILAQSPALSGAASEHSLYSCFTSSAHGARRPLSSGELRAVRNEQ